MKTYEEDCEAQIEEILDEFDFVKVHNVMTHLGWTWKLEGVPTVGDLRRSARRMLRIIAYLMKNDESKYRYTGTGGFYAHAHKGVDAKGQWIRLRLSFEVTDWESDDEEKLGYQ